MKPLLRCDRGAIMVMALFMAIFATGCLYYLSGIAEAVAQRERMQDAADAAAFSAAVLHARGMNVIALINMTMAALLAVLIALKVVELVSIIGVGIAGGLAFVTAGASLIAVPPLTTAGLLATEAYEAAQPVVHTTLRALHLAARGVRIAIPWVAQAQTVHSIAKRYEPYASFAFAVPGTLTLPTRDGTFDDLCTKSGEYVGDLANYGLGPIPTDGFGLSGIVTELVDGGSGYFCGTDGAKAPAVARRNKIWHPILPKGHLCKESAERARQDREPPRGSAHEQLCAEGERESAAAEASVDVRTGECVKDCGQDGLYDLLAARAIEACAPRSDNDAALSRFWWQERRFKRRYLWDDGRWVIDELVVPGSERLRSVKDAWWRPCGSETATVGEAWHTDQWRDDELIPICDDIALPIGPPLYGGDTLEVEHTEVLRLFRCREVVSERHGVDGAGGALSAGGDDDDMAPQLIAEGALLGDEPFQVRAIVVGELPSTSPASMLGQLHSDEAKRNDDETAAWQATEQLGRLSVAQAEFYFDDANAQPDSYLWAMRWTARLRPFRLPLTESAPRKANDIDDAIANSIGEVFGTFDAACEAAHAVASSLTGDFSCSDIDLDDIADLIAH